MTVIDFESDQAVTTPMGGGAFATTVVTEDGKKVTKMSVPPGFDWVREIAVSLKSVVIYDTLMQFTNKHDFLFHSAPTARVPQILPG